MKILINENKTNTQQAVGCHNTPPPPASLPFDLESGVRVTCDVGYLCANCSLLRPICSRLIGPMYATDRLQTRIIA